MAFSLDETGELRDKIHECRHNEIVTYIVCALGVVFFLFGLAFPSFFLWVGVGLFTVGLAFNVNYSIQRLAHQRQLEYIKGKAEKNQSS